MNISKWGSWKTLTGQIALVSASRMFSWAWIGVDPWQFRVGVHLARTHTSRVGQRHLQVAMAHLQFNVGPIYGAVLVFKRGWYAKR